MVEDDTDGDVDGSFIDVEADGEGETEPEPETDTLVDGVVDTVTEEVDVGTIIGTVVAGDFETGDDGVTELEAVTVARIEDDADKDADGAFCDRVAEDEKETEDDPETDALAE